MDLVYSRSGIEIKRMSHGVLGLVLAAHAGLLLALMSYQKELLLPVEQPILISLITPEAAPKPEVAPKPEPVRLKPVKPVIKPVQKPIIPQAQIAQKQATALVVYQCKSACGLGKIISLTSKLKGNLYDTQ